MDVGFFNPHTKWINDTLGIIREVKIKMTEKEVVFLDKILDIIDYTDIEKIYKLNHEEYVSVRGDIQYKLNQLLKPYNQNTLLKKTLEN